MSPRGSNYTGKHNWDTPQPLQLATTAEYIEAAYERREEFRQIVDNFAKACGMGVGVIAPSVKTQDSADRKLWDRTSNHFGEPHMIGDYLRARVLVPVSPYNGVNQLVGATERLMDHSRTVGFKDCYFKPNGAGHRVFIAHMDVDGMQAELQVLPNDSGRKSVITNLVTEDIRAYERHLRTAEERYNVIFGDKSPDADTAKAISKKVGQAEKKIGHIRECRKILHDFTAAVIGIDVLMNPEIAENHRVPSGREVLKAAKEAVQGYFGRPLQNRIYVPVQQLVAGHC